MVSGHSDGGDDRQNRSKMKILTKGGAGGCRPYFSLLSKPSHHSSVWISATGALFQAAGMAAFFELSQSVKDWPIASGGSRILSVNRGVETPH